MPIEIGIVVPHGSRRSRAATAQRVEKRRLPRSTRAENGHELAGFHGEVDVSQEGLGTAGGRVADDLGESAGHQADLARPLHRTERRSIENVGEARDLYARPGRERNATDYASFICEGSIGAVEIFDPAAIGLQQQARVAPGHHG